MLWFIHTLTTPEWYGLLHIINISRHLRVYKEEHQTDTCMMDLSFEEMLWRLKLQVLVFLQSKVHLGLDQSLQDLDWCIYDSRVV